ncbi:MAG: hypothetical protein J1G04_03275 [Clostridiales bacterium]|nr:hypothetical protein [Clostridiales bacterium]
MLKSFNKMFIETLKLQPDMWLMVLLAVVVVAFAVPLVIGLVAGDFKRVTSLMKSVAAKPDSAVAFMKKMPAGIKKNYKRARTIQVGGVSPSDFLSQEDCVESLYRSSLISKVWLVTLAATLICAGIAFVVAPLSVMATRAMVESGKLAADKVDGAVLDNAPYLMPTIILIVGGLLTLVGGIVGRLAHSGGVKAYEAFIPALDGKKGGAAVPNANGAPVNQAAQGFNNFGGQPEQVVEPVAEPYVAQEPVYEAAEPVVEPMYGEPMAEPVIMTEPTESEEEIRRRAREEAIARARAEQEAMQAQAAAQAQAQAAAQAAAQAQAQAAAQAAAQAQAQAAAQAAAQAQAHAAPTGGSSADEVIARIDQISREGAPRETMREVATLLQKERAKPENKTPEQQKKLNDALSKLLKAMSAANRS